MPLIPLYLLINDCVVYPSTAVTLQDSKQLYRQWRIEFAELWYAPWQTVLFMFQLSDNCVCEHQQLSADDILAGFWTGRTLKRFEEWTYSKRSSALTLCAQSGFFQNVTGSVLAIFCARLECCYHARSGY